MRRVDAAAFAGTAAVVLMVDAVTAITIGCSLHLLHYVYRRFYPLPGPSPLPAPQAAAASPAGAKPK